jgi:membrane-bound lytic murein transglycosylase B
MVRRAFIRPVLAAALLFATALPAWASGPEGFAAFVRQIGQEAAAAGLDAAAVRRELGSVVYDPKVIGLDNKQPEHTITFNQYAENALKGDRVGKGQRLLGQYCSVLKPIEARTGVPAEVIMALWGSETNYGRFMGRDDVLQSVINLAYEGRPGKFIDRRAMFREQAIAALKILASGRYSRSSLRGSYAGAFGHHQFMPVSFLNAAIDGDGDGRADIINNPADSFASAANLLLQKGWRPGRPWGREVQLPAKLLDDKLGVQFKQPVSAWRELGVVLRDGSPLPAADDVEDKASLVIPDRASGRAYLFYANAHAIWNWNNSSWFTIMTDRIATQIAASSRAACPRSSSP